MSTKTRTQKRDNAAGRTVAVPRQAAAERTPDLAILSVRSCEEIQNVIDTARQRPVVAHLDGEELNQRMLDFMAGAAYAIEGEIYHVANKVYVLAPKNCEVSLGGG